MSGQPYRYAKDVQNFRNEYMETLGLRANIDDMNFQANKNYKASGVLPPQSSMKDTRTTPEILMDTEKLKLSIIADLAPICSSQMAQLVIQRVMASPLNGDGSFFVWFAQNTPELVNHLRKKYKFGIAGNANDAEQMYLFLQTVYSKTKELNSSVRSAFDRPAGSDVRGLSTGDLDGLLRQYGEIYYSLISQNHAKTQYTVDLCQEIKGKCEAMADLLSSDMYENVKQMFFQLSRATNEFEQYEINEDGYHDWIEYTEQLPSFPQLKTLLSQIKKSETNSDPSLTERLLFNLSSLLPSVNQSSTMKQKIQNILSTNVGSTIYTPQPPSPAPEPEGLAYNPPTRTPPPLFDGSSSNQIRMPTTIINERTPPPLVGSVPPPLVDNTTQSTITPPPLVDNSGPQGRESGWSLSNESVPTSQVPLTPSQTQLLSRFTERSRSRSDSSSNLLQPKRTNASENVISIFSQNIPQIDNPHGLTEQEIDISNRMNIDYTNPYPIKLDSEQQRFISLAYNKDTLKKYSDKLSNKNAITLDSGTTVSRTPQGPNRSLSRYESDEESKQNEPSRESVDSTSSKGSRIKARISENEARLSRDESYKPPIGNPHKLTIKQINICNQAGINYKDPNEIKLTAQQNSFLQSIMHQFSSEYQSLWYQLSTSEEVLNRFEAHRIEGIGIRRRGRPKGSGLVKPISERIDQTKGVKQGHTHVPFGKYIINKNKLDDDIISLKHERGYGVKGYPSAKITKNLSRVFKTIIGGGVPRFEELSSLTDDEKKYLHEVSKKAGIMDKISIPTPSKDQQEQDVHSFEVMKGELLAGNDSPELVKKFKLLVLKLSKNGSLPRRESAEIMEDLISLGF